MATSAATARRKAMALVKVGLGGIASFVGINLYTGNEKFYKEMLMPTLHNCIDPESSHKCAVAVAKYKLIPRPKLFYDKTMETSLFGLKFMTPVGLAAGFDKNGEAVEGLFKIGFSFVEIGSVTPEPQEGNPLPRVFRLGTDNAVINRYGFNSDGHEVVFERLRQLPSRKEDSGLVLGVNLGKNKTSPDAIKDYVEGITKFGDICDYLVINISSPNTPGLRSLQDGSELTLLVRGAITARNSMQTSTSKPSLLVKVAPDLTASQITEISNVVIKEGVDGLIVSNTTIGRPDHLKSPEKTEQGGLSGEPLRDLSTEVIKQFYKATNGRVPIIGVGGIGSGEDAYQKIRAGASLVQLYSALVYQGPPVVAAVTRDLHKLVEKDGFNSVQDAVGVDVQLN